MILDVKPVHDSSAPGWWIDLDEAMFLVWAPRPDRPHWSACWETWRCSRANPELVEPGSERSRFDRAATLEAVLDVFNSCPDRDLGARARRLLSGAARADTGSTEPNGDN